METDAERERWGRIAFDAALAEFENPLRWHDVREHDRRLAERYRRMAAAVAAAVREEERARVVALVAAAHALDEALYDSLNNSRIPARVRDAHIGLAAALAALDAGEADGTPRA